MSVEADAAERAVIGAMLGSARAVTDILDGGWVEAKSFRDPELGALFTAIIEVQSEFPKAISVDWLLVGSRADTTRRLTPLDLQKIKDASPVAGNVGYYARQVADAAGIRSYAEAASAVTAAIAAGHELETIAQKAQNALLSAQNARPSVGMQGKLYEAVMDEQDAAYDWVVPGFLERGDRFVLTGTEGAGKSMLMRQAAVLTAAGINFVTSADMTPRRVLVVDVENSERMWRRTTAKMWGNVQARGKHTEGRMRLECHGRIDLTRGDHLGSIHRLIDQHQPDLMMIGPLYKLTPKAITSDDDAAPIITALDSIRERGIALMLETHMGHTKGASGDRDVRPRGSAALLGWPEAGFGLAQSKDDPSEGNPDSLVVDMIPWRGQRDPRDWPKQWMRGGEWPWTRFS